MLAPASVPVWIEAVAAVFAALGTVGAVVLALWLQVLRERQRKPSLQMTFSGGPESNEWAPVYRERAKSLWLRFVVKNAPGRNTARDVQVLVTRVVTPTGRRELVPGGPLHWTDLRTPATDLPAGIWRMIDVATVELPEEEGAPTALWLQVSPATGDIRHRLEPGAYDVELALTAQGLDAGFYHTNLTFREEREEDPKDLRKHLTVSGLWPGPLPNPHPRQQHFDSVGGVAALRLRQRIAAAFPAESEDEQE